MPMTLPQRPNASMSARPCPPGPTQTAYTVSLGGCSPLAAINRLGRIMNPAALPAVLKNARLFAFISLLLV